MSEELLKEATIDLYHKENAELKNSFEELKFRSLSKLQTVWNKIMLILFVISFSILAFIIDSNSGLLTLVVIFFLVGDLTKTVREFEKYIEDLD